MVIDTVVLKASYDLMTERMAYDYTLMKFAEDVAKGRELRTLKLTRFVDSDGYDYLKFNFPVCGHLSSADLMVVYCAMAGFSTYVVGNAERGRRDDVIRRTLGLDNIRSVPELDVPVELDAGASARDGLRFTNTQRRGFSALPAEKRHELILEVAADQPLMYDVARHAVDLSRDADFAINFNAVNLMKLRIPSFIRNGYDRVVNSAGDDVLIKENNNFAQNMRSVEHNRPLFRFLYENRNGGRYFSFSHLATSLGLRGAAVRAARFLIEGMHVTEPYAGALVDELQMYAKSRRTLGRAAPYCVLRSVVNSLLSPSLFRQRAYVDATNDDIFSCWDMDGLNNDYLAYRDLFRRNFNDLGRMIPFADQVYMVHDAFDKEGPGNGMMVDMLFDSKYISLVRGLMWRIHNKSYMRDLGISDDTIDMIEQSGIEDVLFDRAPPEVKMIDDLERHLAESCLPGYAQNRDTYEQLRAA